jgi:hypothetical protein
MPLTDLTVLVALFQSSLQDVLGISILLSLACTGSREPRSRRRRIPVHE